MLDEQAKQGTQVLDAQTKHQKDYLKSQVSFLFYSNVTFILKILVLYRTINLETIIC